MATDDFDKVLKKIAHVPASPSTPKPASPTAPSLPSSPPDAPPTPPATSASSSPQVTLKTSREAAHAAAEAAAAARAAIDAAAASTSAASLSARPTSLPSATAPGSVSARQREAAGEAPAPSRPREATASPMASTRWSGRVLAGRYRLGKQIGVGGMGAVFEANDDVLRRPVAVKLVIERVPTPETVARFQREARAAAALQDPSIVTIYDFGVAESASGGDVPFIVMERVTGTPLHGLLVRGPVPWPRALALVSSIARALAAAHGAGVIHRDLKPANVFVVDENKNAVKLLDFGVSRLLTLEGNADDAVTTSGVIVGTPGYIAPEVTLDGNLEEPRADVYSLGVIAFLMLTGRPPFEAATPVALIVKHATAQAAAPSTRSPKAGIPAAVDAFVLKLLAKDPRERPSAAEAAQLASSIVAEQPASVVAAASAAPAGLTYKARYAQDVLGELERTLPAEKFRAIVTRADAGFIEYARGAKPVENVAGVPLLVVFRSIREELGDDGYIEWWRNYTLNKLVHMPLFSDLLRGVVKIFGLTPHSIFKVLPKARGSLVRSGGTLSYEKVDDGACRMTLVDLPQELMESTVAGITMSAVYEGVIRFVGRSGTAKVEEENVRQGRVVHLVRWQG